MEPAPEVYSVVTRGYMRKSGKVITHTYGPYTEATAKKIRRQIKRNARAIGAHVDASVCKLIDPQGESDVTLVPPPALAGSEVQAVGEGGATPVHWGSGSRVASGPFAKAVLDAPQGQDGSGATE